MSDLACSIDEIIEGSDNVLPVDLDNFRMGKFQRVDETLILTMTYFNDLGDLKKKHPIMKTVQTDFLNEYCNHHIFTGLYKEGFSLMVNLVSNDKKLFSAIEVNHAACKNHYKQTPALTRQEAVRSLNRGHKNSKKTAPY